MSTISQVGSYASYLSLVRNLSQAQNNVADLSQQMQTGRKSDNLKVFGADTQKLLDLRTELVRRQSYLQNIDTAQPRLKATDVVLNTLEDMAADWQSNNLLPFNPGPVRVSKPFNVNPDAMAVRINEDRSKLKLDARYTVTAIPSETQPNGWYDITVTDGLGGTSTRTLNLKVVPPNDGDGYNFKMTGGPGEGAVLNLSFDKLQASSYSSFSVDWPEAQKTRDRVEGQLKQIRQLMNERFGDRYLFAGARYSTEPVGDVLATKQKSVVTLNGGVVEAGDYFEVKVGGRTFSYQVQAADPKNTSFVATQLTNQINASTPMMPITVTQRNGIITLIAQKQGVPFEIDGRVVNAATVENSASTPTTTTTPTTGVAQVDQFVLNGDNVDIGDTFEMTIGVGDKGDPYNQKYYNENPNAPKDLRPYQEYTVRYTVTAQDYAAGLTTVSAVAQRLTTLMNSSTPAPPVTVANSGTIPTTVTLTQDLTAYDPMANHAFNAATNPKGLQSVFTTQIKVVNASLQNTMTVRTLPPEADPITDVPYVGEPTLPFYDSQRATRSSDPAAWHKVNVSVDDDYTLTYGVVSTDPAFQKLIQAFRLARVATVHPGEYEANIQKSRSLLAEAKDDIRSVHAKVASDLATMEEKRNSHKEASNTVTGRIAAIEGIDPTEVSARLSTSMNALEAAYTVAGRTQRLSLLNYLA